MTTTQEWADVTAQAADAVIEAEARAAQLAMPPRRYEEFLPCTLTDEEVAAKADDLEAALAAVDTLKAEKKERTAEIGARLKIAEAQVNEIRQVRRTRIEMRSVEVVESFELRLGVARTTRVDTGEMIRERALRSSELQPSLPGTERPTATSFEDDIEPSEGDVTVIEEPEAMLADSAEEPEARGSKRKKRGS